MKQLFFGFFLMSVTILANSGGVFKNLSATTANELNKSMIYLLYLEAISLNLDDLMYLSHLSQKAQTKEEKEKLLFERNIHECTNVLIAELIWHFDKETLPSDSDGEGIINSGIESQKKLEKINFDCSEHEKKIGSLFDSYVHEILKVNEKVRD